MIIKKGGVLLLAEYLPFIIKGLEKIERLSEGKLRTPAEVIDAIRVQIRVNNALLWVVEEPKKGPQCFAVSLNVYNCYFEPQLFLWIAYGRFVDQGMNEMIAYYKEKYDVKKLVAESFNTSPAVARCWGRHGLKLKTLHFEGDI